MKKVISRILLVFLVVTFQLIVAQVKISPLREAIVNSNPYEVKRLIESGSDVNEKYNVAQLTNITPLFQACTISFLFPTTDSIKAKKIEIVKLLIAGGANANEKFKGMTILMQAVQLTGDPAIVKPLVMGGMDINAKTPGYGRTALHGAVLKGKIKWLKPLIENGADLNAKDRYGFTPLHYAVRELKKDELATLIKAKANVNSVDNHGLTPLDYALQYQYKDLADVLKKHGGKSSKE